MLKRLERIAKDTAGRLAGLFPSDLPAALAAAVCDPIETESVWVQEKESGAKTAFCVLQKNGRASLAAEADADTEELRAFLCASGAREVQAAVGLLTALGMPAQTRCALMRLEMQIPPEAETAFITDGLGGIYDLLVTADGTPAATDEKNAWIARNARGIFGGKTLLTAALADSGEPVACAAADLFGDYAFLRDVASAQNFRNRGLARACVCTLCEPLRERKKQVFLLAAESTAGFYRKCGFIKTDTVGPGNIKS